MTRRSPALARTVVVGGVAVAVVLAGVAPATAVDIVEGDRPVVVVEDQSEFAAIPAIVEADPDFPILAEIEVLPFGGPTSPEITPWTATAVSFDSEDRLYVVLLNGVAGEQFECAIRLYDEAGLPLGAALPVVNPGDDTGLWPSSCTGLALLDILSAYGVDVDLSAGIVDEPAARTDAYVYFANGDLVTVDARSGGVREVVIDEGGAPFGALQAFALSAGPAELLDPTRSGTAVVLVGVFDDVLLVTALFEDGVIESSTLFFPLEVVGAEFDSELNVWIVTREGDPAGSVLLSVSYADLRELDIGPGPTSQGFPGSFGLTDVPQSLSSLEFDGAEATFQPAAISAGLLVTDLGAVLAGGVAIERDAVVIEPAEQAELADTGPNNELLLTLGIIAGALLVGGIVVSALGASRRRSRRD
jgi:hypothetical protein